tara:strand:+ start:335 stop:556 length:222 start_codon:yes stop_codon:yes gene_type:complete
MLAKGDELELEEDIEIDDGNDLDIEDEEIDLDVDDDSDTNRGGLVQSTSKRVRMIFSVMASPNRIDYFKNSQL